MNKFGITIGSVFIFTAILLGAFGAHALKEIISIEKISSFEVGIRYQMYHGLALLILNSQADKFSFSLRWVNRLLVAGTVLFSVSIYLLAIQEIIPFAVRWLGPVTPIGGTLLLVSWGLFLVRVIRNQ
jgi:uncharacterized membrane protein YgdD (TMEM256/DUF423 family)